MGREVATWKLVHIIINSTIPHNGMLCSDLQQHVIASTQSIKQNVLEVYIIIMAGQLQFSRMKVCRK